MRHVRRFAQGKAARNLFDSARRADERAGLLIERLNRQTTAIARMLEDLLDASSIAFGKISIEVEPVDLLSLLRDTSDEQESRARAAGLQLTARLGETPCFVSGDRVRLRQIVDNLLSNAIKFTPAGGRVQLTLAVGSDSAVVSILDTGIGFESAFSEELFQPFVQHEQGRDRTSGGLGLGLAIAERLANLQNGSLTASSPGMGRGALFTLTIPIAPRSSGASVRAGSVLSFGSKSVLLVEDNRDVADGIAELLRLHGVSVRVAYDGASAIKSAMDAVPDLILCDLGLPGGMDGLAVARACRAEKALRDVRLVATSGYSSAEDHANATTAGFDSLMTKPVTEEALSRLFAS